jgi:hypothetical protein
MTETAALLADEVLPQKPLRQWVLSLPFALRFLLATDADALTRVLGIVHRAISGSTACFSPVRRLPCSAASPRQPSGSCRRS